MSAGIDSKLWWYIARSSGIVSWLILSVSIIWGVLLAGRLIKTKGAPRWLDDLHRFLGALSIAFVLVHMLGLFADSYTHFAWKELFVPFGSPWKTGAVAWGVVAFYFLLAVELTSLVRKRIPRKWWRGVHFASYGLYVMATIHGIYSGTDRHKWYFAKGAVIVVIITVVAIGNRALQAWKKKQARTARKSGAVA